VAGASDGFGSQARFSSPSALAVDSAGYIYVADMGNNTIRKISPSGDVRTLAGSAGQAGRIDGEGAQARFMAPSGIAVDNSGNVYVAEFASGTIRKISPEGSVSSWPARREIRAGRTPRAITPISAIRGPWRWINRATSMWPTRITLSSARSRRTGRVATSQASPACRVLPMATASRPVQGPARRRG
jgi:hypothetical protein